MLASVCQLHRCDRRISCPLPSYTSRVSAGFPSPAEDYIEQSLDLNELLIQHPSSSFFLRVEGNSMIGAGIGDGDLLLVDRAVEPTNGRIVIAVIDGELTVKRLCYTQAGQPYLYPENPDYPPINISEETDCHLWGVVTNVIKAV
ncbi:MAG: translesion error-prone DNA polymerase V autoproteolytic subunit [Cyanobacteria bacterium J06641_5]